MRKIHRKWAGDPRGIRSPVNRAPEYSFGNPFDAETYMTNNEIFVQRMEREELLAEYEAIQRKKSQLSSSVRAIIVDRVHKLNLSFTPIVN